MGGEFCDWEPCKLLKQAIIHFLSSNYKPGEDIKFDMVDHRHAGKDRQVYLTYCPFCGTRVRGNPEIVKWAGRLKSNGSY